MGEIMLVPHVTLVTQVKVVALGTLPAHAVYALPLALVTDDVGMLHTLDNT